LGDARSVARWEEGSSKILPVEDLVIHQIYLAETGQRPRFVDTSRKVAKLKRRLKGIVYKAKSKHSWTVGV